MNNIPALFRCKICNHPALRPKVSTIYSRANVCGEKCYAAWRERNRARYEKAPKRPCRVHTKRPKPEPVAVVEPEV